MNKNDVVYEVISELTILSENKNEVYNIIIPLILSKNFFKNSKEKREFVEEILQFEIADYAYRSKSILIGKIVSRINDMSVAEAVTINKKINEFILEVAKANKIALSKNEKEKKTKNKKTSFFSNWNEYINGHKLSNDKNAK